MTEEQKANLQPKEEVIPQKEEKSTTKKVEVPEKFQSLVSEIEKMKVSDLAELVKALEEKFGVSPAAPVMAVAGAVAGGAAEPEQSTFNVELTEAGGNKIAVIKVIREITQKGLKESKDLVDGAPKVIKEGASKQEAEDIKKKLETAGSKVTLK